MSGGVISDLHNVLEVKMRRIEADANDLIRYGHDLVRLRRIVSDIAILREARDRDLLADCQAGLEGDTSKQLLGQIPEGDRFADPLKFRRLGVGGGSVLYECWSDAVQAYAAQQVAAERERCARIVDIPAGTEAWEVIGGEEGLAMLRELAAQIRRV